jgi:hypothetical protein
MFMNANASTLSGKRSTENSNCADSMRQTEANQRVSDGQIDQSMNVRCALPRTWFQQDNLLLAELVDADGALAAIGVHQHTMRLIRISHQRRSVVAHSFSVNNTNQR